MKERRSENIRIIDKKCDKMGLFSESWSEYLFRTIVSFMLIEQIPNILLAAASYSVHIYFYPGTRFDIGIFSIAMGLYVSVKSYYFYCDKDISNLHSSRETCSDTNENYHDYFRYFLDQVRY